LAIKLKAKKNSPNIRRKTNKISQKEIKAKEAFETQCNTNESIKVLIKP